MKQIDTVPECYGMEYNKWKKCKYCACQRWCRGAGDPKLLQQNMRAITDSHKICDQTAYEQKMPSEEFDFEVPEYSRQEMLEVIVLLMALDFQTLEMLEQKINNPAVTFAEMGKRKRVSRQAMHQFITKKCLEVPELEAVFKSRRTKSRINKLAA